MPLMKDKWGDTINIPDNQVQTALNSGYTYVSQPSSSPAPAPSAPPPTQSSSNQQVQTYNVVGGTFTGTQEQYNNYIATHPQTQPNNQNQPAPASSPYTVGSRIYGPEAAAAAQAAGYTLINGRDASSSWPSYEIGPKAVAPTPTGPQIKFVDGLSDAQKTSITNLLKRTTPMSQTDAKNYGFATGTPWEQYVGKTPQEILGTSSSSGTQQGGSSAPSLVPGEIESNPLYATLSDDQKKLIGLAYQASTATSAEARAKLNAALADAIKVVDPIMKEQIRLVQDELNRNVTSTSADSKSNIDQLNERIRQIKEDLAYNRENLSIDQQQELSQALAAHEEKLYQTQQSMAESGLAFSSPRARAEDLLKSEYQDMTESTTRKYNRANRTNDVTAARDVATLTRNAADLERNKGERLTTLARSAEEKVGSGNLPSVPGVTPLGNVTGTIEQNKQKLLAGLEADLSTDYLGSYLS